MVDLCRRDDGKLNILLPGAALLGVRMVARLEEAGEVELTPTGEVERDGQSAAIRLSNGQRRLQGEVRVRLLGEEGTARVEFSAGAANRVFSPEVSFLGQESLSLVIGGIEGAEKLLAEALFCPWWTKPCFPASLREVPGKTQHMLCRIGKKHLLLQPLPGKRGKADLSGCGDGLALTVHANETGYPWVEGAMACAFGDNPFRVVETAYDACRQAGDVVTPPRRGKQFPEMMEYLGWCSWNAFYSDVDEAGLLAKLQEFREKGLPLSWMLIDDGWSQLDREQGKLTGFDADGAKFPRGLSGVIREAKERYGVRWVGVWHAFNGYWNGVLPDSPVAREMARSLSGNKAGWLLPGFTFPQAFEFYNTWHRRLREAGVDFVKVDNQSSAIRYTRNSAPLSAIRAAHDALEASVRLNFPAPLINCMGMAAEDTFARERSAVTRNSDDFFPDRKGSFVSHIMQNAYNAVFQGPLYICDFDMWWTRHESAVASGVLRAISGGPVYISDKVGQTDPAMLWPLMTEDGRLLRCDHPALPAPSCLYENVPEESGVLKLTNRAGDNAVTAAFNLTGEERKCVIRREDTECLPDTAYLAHLHFAGRYVPFDGALELTLPAAGAEIVNLYPVRDGYALVGDPEKYIGAACPDKRRMKVNGDE